jgi:hypothetical protein
MIVPNHRRRLGQYAVTYRTGGRTVTRTFRTPDHAHAFLVMLGRRSRARIETLK